MMYGKCSLIKVSLTDMIKLQSTWESVAKQFPFLKIKSHHNKGWVVILKDIKSSINQIFDKIKGVAIQSTMPWIVDYFSDHLSSVHGDNKKALVIKIPRDSLFAIDKQYLDYTSCVVFACQERFILWLVRGLLRTLNTWKNSKVPFTMQAYFQ